MQYKIRIKHLWGTCSLPAFPRRRRRHGCSVLPPISRVLVPLGAPKGVYTPRALAELLCMTVETAAHHPGHEAAVPIRGESTCEATYMPSVNRLFATELTCLHSNMHDALQHHVYVPGSNK